MDIRLSRFLSLILRHRPQAIGLTLDEGGWVDIETASKVGRRHGNLVILQIDAQAMHAAGHQFFLSQNGVWLTDSVPAVYLIEIP